jgi:exodeoxyribonuclease V alpha subunit
VNEVRARLGSLPAVAAAATDADLTLLDALVRHMWREEPECAGGELDEALVCGLFLLVRAVRLDHAALDLSDESLRRDLDECSLDDVATDSVVAALCGAGALVERVNLAHPISATGAPIVVGDVDGVARFCHLRRFAYAEWRLATALLAASRHRLDDDLARLADSANNDPVLANLAARRISVVTGGPGTGKTTSVARALGTLGAAAATRGGTTLRVALCAPTAKAAVRLREALSAHSLEGLDIDERSGSVHRLLGLGRDDRRAGGDVDADIVIIDEVSMLELELLDLVVARASDSTRIVLVGDPDQLASVNVGAALRDVVTAADGALRTLVTRLERNYRSDEAIQRAAEAVNAGDLAALELCAAATPTALRLEVPSAEALAVATAAAASLEEAAIDEHSALEALGRFVVLAATRHGAGSIEHWRALVGAPAEARRAAARFAVGEPVLISRNEPAAGDGSELHNGDLGVVVNENDRVQCVFGPASAPRRRILTRLGEAESAYAITIHKSQGSEYDDVIVSLPPTPSRIVTRELLYTAMTRARRSIWFVANREVLAAGLARRIDRVSALAERVDALSASVEVAE